MKSESKNDDQLVRVPERKNNQPASRRHGASISIVICVIVSVMTGLIGLAIGTRLQNLSLSNLDYTELDEVYATLKHNYDGNLDRKKLIEGAAKGMVDAAGDPYTTYLTATDAKSLTEDLSGSFYGVGIEMGLNKDRQLEIMSVLDGGSAKKAGLQTGDLIAAVNGESSINWTPTQAASQIRGESGTKVKLTIIRGNEQKDYELERARVDNPSVTWEVKDGIGFIRISQFGDDTGDLATKAAKELKSKNVKGIVLDLRDNGGGYVDAAQAVASLWVDNGKTVVEERKNGQVVQQGTVRATGGNILKGIKTVVLVNGGTASASEIVSGALKDYGLATLVGNKTYGKGSVQTMSSLSNGDNLKITVAKWYTPKGKNINHNGLEPDVKVNLDTNKYLNDHTDTQQDKAVELLKQS